MGNSASSSGRGHHEESVDFGFLIPQGIYTGPRDWNQPIVSQLICQRRLAPFYRPLEDYEDSWDDEQILAARKETPLPEGADAPETATRHELAISRHGHSKRPSNLKEPSKPEAVVYRGAVECPICFMYYPPNINRSRCCDHPICTECFVQIKRAEPTTTHLVSEPAACPYCVQENFGVVYKPPPWRAGIGADNSSLWSDSPKSSPQPSEPGSSPYPTHKRRQKSFGADSPEVVTIDQIRPDWEAKLAAVQAAVQRRANRRIIMRQVGDRLIPVGITSGRVHALSPEEAAQHGEGGDDSRGSRRSRRRRELQERQPGAGYDHLMGMSGQDLEELMVMEAIRLSIAEHEDHQRKEAEEKRRKEAEAAAEAAAEGGSNDSTSTGPSSVPVSTEPLTTITPSTPLAQPTPIPAPAPIPVPAPAHTSARATDDFLSPDFQAAGPSLPGSMPRRRSPSPAPAQQPQLSSSHQSQTSAHLQDSHGRAGSVGSTAGHSRTPSWSRRTPSTQPQQYGTLGAALTGAANTAILKTSRNGQVGSADNNPFADPGSVSASCATESSVPAPNA